MNNKSTKFMFYDVRLVVVILVIIITAGCGVAEPIQRKNTFNEFIIMRNSAALGKPIPELSSNPIRYGKYKPLLVYYRNLFIDMIKKDAEFKIIQAKLNDCLKPAKLVSAQERVAYSKKITNIINIANSLELIIENLYGTSAENNINQMSIETDFVKGFFSGISNQKGKIEIISKQLQLFKIYYEKIQNVLNLAESSSPEIGKNQLIIFKNPNDAHTYNNYLSELTQIESELNANSEIILKKRDEIIKKINHEKQ